MSSTSAKRQIIENLAKEICCIEGVEDVYAIVEDLCSPTLTIIFRVQITPKPFKKQWKEVPQLLEAAHQQLAELPGDRLLLRLELASSSTSMNANVITYARSSTEKDESDHASNESSEPSPSVD